MKIMLPDNTLDRLKLLTYLLIIFLYCKSFLDNDPLRCQNLISSKSGSYVYDKKYKDSVYQPNGCMYHNYTSKDVAKCLGGVEFSSKLTWDSKYLANSGLAGLDKKTKEDKIKAETSLFKNYGLTVIGDSRARQIYHRLRGLKNDVATTAITKSHESHKDEDLNLSMAWATNPREIALVFQAYNALIKGETPENIENIENLELSILARVSILTLKLSCDFDFGDFEL